MVYAPAVAAPSWSICTSLGRSFAPSVTLVHEFRCGGRWQSDPRCRPEAWIAAVDKHCAPQLCCRFAVDEPYRIEAVGAVTQSWGVTSWISREWLFPSCSFASPHRSSSRPLRSQGAVRRMRTARAREARQPQKRPKSRRRPSAPLSRGQSSQRRSEPIAKRDQFRRGRTCRRADRRRPGNSRPTAGRCCRSYLSRDRRHRRTRPHRRRDRRLLFQHRLRGRQRSSLQPRRRSWRLALPGRPRHRLRLRPRPLLFSRSPLLRFHRPHSQRRVCRPPLPRSRHRNRRRRLPKLLELRPHRPSLQRNLSPRPRRSSSPLPSR